MMGVPSIPSSALEAVQWAIDQNRQKAAALGATGEPLIISGASVFERLTEIDPEVAAGYRPHVKKVIIMAARHYGCEVWTRAKGRPNSFGSFYLPAEEVSA